MKHTLHDNILGEIDYEGERWKYTYQWSSDVNDELVVFGVVRMQAMKTGCTVLHLDTGSQIVIAPGYRFCIQERTNEAPCTQD